MKILLDTCVWGGVAHELRAAGHEVVWYPLFPLGFLSIISQKANRIISSIPVFRGLSSSRGILSLAPYSPENALDLSRIALVFLNSAYSLSACFLI